jgi:O-antigen/teichoic acid export membrane protein
MINTRKVFSGVLWVIGARQAERVLGVISIAILARALSPADFGVVALAGSVVVVVEVLSRFGFDWALIRLSSPTVEHYNTAWTLRVITGGVVSAIIGCLSYPASVIFHRPDVLWLIVALAANITIASLENIWVAEYRRQTLFRPEFQLRVGAKIAGFLSSVSIALMTHSYWALAIGMIASTATSVTMSYFIHKKRPRFSLSQTRDLLGLSLWVLISNAADAFRAKAAEMWMGRQFGASSVGHYALASEISSLAGEELAAPINRVVFSDYAKMGGDAVQMRSAYLRVSGVIWSVALPAAIGIWLCAHQIVLVLLGQQWHESADILKVLAIVGLINVIAANTKAVFISLGNGRLVTVLSLSGFLLFVVFAIAIGVHLGPVGVAWAEAAASLVVVAATLVSLTKILGIHPATYIAWYYRVVLASLIMTIYILWFGQFLHGRWAVSPILELAGLVCSGAGIYFVALYSLWVLSGRREGAEAAILTVIQSWRGHAQV